MPQFRAKARAVDLLGKGSIADLPTAISELWKNGYDAYGDNLEAYLYQKDYEDFGKDIFVLCDDGKGMDSEDIIDKWFVLGTDSKSRRSTDVFGEDTLYKIPRVKMGEKGVGRLAVAYLGSQMLMLTKKKNNFLEAVFFDWRILDNFDLFLGDINIPSQSITSADIINDVFDNLKAEFLSNFDVLLNRKDPWIEQAQLKQSIIEDCNNLILPNYIIDTTIADLASDTLNGHSTRFIIFNPDQQIIELPNFAKNDETKDFTDSNSANHTISALAGLFNLFKSTENSHSTKFWVVNSNGKYDLLNFKSFFSNTDFNLSDHEIDGSFDDIGNFTGRVRIYKKEIEHVFKPIKKQIRSQFGPFSLKLGYVSGSSKETLLNEEMFKSFNEKLELYGGLYIYRDGFRVLPYGRLENDFLEFEERRSKSAGDNFFAKRRMFGYIEISREINYRLIDKSSREGFVNNAAYRDFKATLIAFFKDLAKKYFATNAEYDYKNVQKDELTKLALAEKNEKQRDIEARREFAKQLKLYPQQLDNIEIKYKSLIDLLKNKIEVSDIVFEEIQQILTQIEDCKIQLQNINVTKPTRYKPTELQNKNFYAFKKHYSEVQKVFESSAPVMVLVREKLKVHELFKEFEAKHQLFNNTLINQFRDYRRRLDSVTSKLENQFVAEQESYINDFQKKYHSIIPSKTDVIEINRSNNLLESIFNETRERISTRIEPFLSHIDRINFDVNEDDLVGFYKIQFEEMKEEWNKTYELAQLGIAVEIIDHQFNTLYSQLAENIRSMEKNLLPGNESTSKYNLLVNAFNHLEDNYKLLQPLYRTTGRIRTDITGLELFEYVSDFFGTRLSGIDYDITASAKQWKAFSFDSIFKPVLINIVNNAIYWLQASETKIIQFNVVEENLIISNSGEPIEDFQLEDIFKLFYSQRPKGRGIGLYLAKKSLNGIGYDIFASNDPKYNLLGGASFVISKIQ